MATRRYLALTAAEFAAAEPLPPGVGWMACHFSPYGTGLSNLPSALPPGSLLILNDRIPFRGHDPIRIGRELEGCIRELGCSALLMDFQTPDLPELQALAAHLTGVLPCPCPVSRGYAAGLDCPVFLSPCPHHTHLAEHIAPWQGRELWLDLAVDAETITLTNSGAVILPLPLGVLPEGGHRDEKLHCHYRTETGADHARFTLWRTREDLEALAQGAADLGIRALVGLWQELRRERRVECEVRN